MPCSDSNPERASPPDSAWGLPDQQVLEREIVVAANLLASQRLEVRSQQELIEGLVAELQACSRVLREVSDHMADTNDLLRHRVDELEQLSLDIVRMLSVEEQAIRSLPASKAVDVAVGGRTTTHATGRRRYLVRRLLDRRRRN